MDNLHTYFERINKVICEPTTAITDFLLFLFCLWCTVSLFSISAKKDYLKKWSFFFLFMSVVTFMGGLAHSVSCLHYEFYYKLTWVCMQLSSGLALYFAQAAVFATEISRSHVKRSFQLLAKLQLACFIICVFVFMDFKVVAANSFIGLLQLFVFCFPKNDYNREYKSMVSAGFLISFLTIYVNHKKISFASWFNYNDISHVIMFLSLLLIYKGIRYKHHRESFFK